MKKYLVLASLSLALAIILGAFGAHGLKTYFLGREEEIWKTAGQYHFIGTISVFLSVIFFRLGYLPERQALIAIFMQLFGTLIFSGTLYLLVLSRISMLGAITPIGGSLLILSWLLLAYAIFKAKA